MRHAVLTPFFGQLRDRFSVYHEPRSIVDKIDAAARIDGVEGIEVIFPDEVDDPEQIQAALDRHGLAVAAVNVNLKGEPRFQHGALSSPDAAVRARAVDLLCAGKRLAVALGAPRITCAPLADGYDYTLQIDYRQAWTRMVDSLSAAAAYLPGVTMHVEHKPGEPRTRGLLDVPAKILLLCRDIGLPGVGVTFNVGHALCGTALPAAALADVMHAGLPYYLHVCDASGGWDWDLRAGAQHVWQWAECLFYLKQDGYDGWLTADTFPVRQDAEAIHASNVSITRSICAWLDRLDAAAIADGLSRHNAMHMLKELEQCLPPRS
jgi:xylose isomerase